MREEEEKDGEEDGGGRRGGGGNKRGREREPNELLNCGIQRAKGKREKKREKILREPRLEPGIKS